MTDDLGCAVTFQATAAGSKKSICASCQSAVREALPHRTPNQQAAHKRTAPSTPRCAKSPRVHEGPARHDTESGRGWNVTRTATRRRPGNAAPLRYYLLYIHNTDFGSVVSLSYDTCRHTAAATDCGRDARVQPALPDHHHLGFSHACVASSRTSLPSHRLLSHTRDTQEVNTRRHGPPPTAGTTRSSRPRRRDLRPLCHTEAPAPLPPAVASGTETLNSNSGGPR